MRARGRHVGELMALATHLGRMLRDAGREKSQHSKLARLIETSPKLACRACAG